MFSAIPSRLFHALLTVVPHLEQLGESTSLRAKSGAHGDLDLFLYVERPNDQTMNIELSHGHFDKTPSSTTYSLTVDLSSKVATVNAIHDGWRYEVIISDSGSVNPRTKQMQIQAINWLAVISNLKYDFKVSAEIQMHSVGVE